MSDYQSNNGQSYQDMYQELYGNNVQNGFVGNQQLETKYQQVQQQAQYQQMANLNNAIGVNRIRPQDNVIIDNIANLEYAKKGYNNVSASTSQYGLADLDAKDWSKYTMYLIIPIFNVVFFMYYGYFKAFIQYPTLKEWSKSAIVPSICIDVLYAIIVFFLTIPL